MAPLAPLNPPMGAEILKPRDPNDKLCLVADYNDDWHLGGLAPLAPLNPPMGAEILKPRDPNDKLCLMAVTVLTK